MAAKTAAFLLVPILLAGCGFQRDLKERKTPDPRREKIVFAARMEEGTGLDLYVIHPDGTGLRQLTRTPSISEHLPSWSPDGKQVAYLMWGNGPDSVCVMNEDGTGSRVLAYGSDPDWSPNGSTIAYMNHGDIWLYDLATGIKRNLTNRVGPDSYPSWSPDGSRIVFTGNDGSGDVGNEVYVINADGSGRTRLTDHYREGSYLMKPQWSPDGRRIAVEISGGGLAIVDPDGSSFTKLRYAGFAPAWSPDSKRLLVNNMYSLLFLDLETNAREVLFKSAKRVSSADWWYPARE